MLCDFHRPKLSCKKDKFSKVLSSEHKMGCSTTTYFFMCVCEEDVACHQAVR